jgi:hypothetical protein
MIVFYSPKSIGEKILRHPIVNPIGALTGIDPVADFLFPKKQKAPHLPASATPEGDAEAEDKAGEEASRRARASVATGRQDAILAGGAAAPQLRRRTLLGTGGPGGL